MKRPIQKGKSKRGGARSGAGRKSSLTTEYQQARRDAIAAAVTDADWQKIVEKAIEDAKAGDKSARDWLASWIVGKVPDELKLSNGEDGAFQIVVSQAAYDAV